MYVVDASVVVQSLIADTYSKYAEKLLRQKLELYVPEFCRIECANVIWKQVRFHNMPITTAEKLAEDLEDLAVILMLINSIYLPSLQLGIRYNLAVYDAVYVVLAQRLNCPLITVDQRQAMAAFQEGVTLKPITDFMP